MSDASLRRTSRPLRGQAMVEFALVLPVFILIVVGVLDLGRLTYAYNTIAYVARQGARYGTIYPTPSSNIISAATQGVAGLDLSQLVVGVSYPDGASYAGARVQVNVSYSFFAATPLVDRVWGGGGFPLQAASTMRIE